MRVPARSLGTRPSPSCTWARTTCRTGRGWAALRSAGAPPEALGRRSCICCAVTLNHTQLTWVACIPGHDVQEIIDIDENILIGLEESFDGLRFGVLA